MSVVSKFLTADWPEPAKFLNVADAACEQGLLVVRLATFERIMARLEGPCPRVNSRAATWASEYLVTGKPIERDIWVYLGIVVKGLIRIGKVIPWFVG